MTETTNDLNPPPRLLLGPGPINADPRVLRTMSMPMLGQFDPVFTGYMNETMGLLRRLYQTENQWAFLGFELQFLRGLARAGIEAILTSLIAPGDRVLVPVFGRFGHLLCEIAARSGGDVRTMEAEWGTVFTPDQIEDAIKEHRPKVVALVHGDTSTTWPRRRAPSAGAWTRFSTSMRRRPWAAWTWRWTPGSWTPFRRVCKNACRGPRDRRRSPSTSGSRTRSTGAST